MLATDEKTDLFEARVKETAARFADPRLTRDEATLLIEALCDLNERLFPDKKPQSNVTFSDVLHAHRTLKTFLKKTPLQATAKLSRELQVPAYLKREDLNPTRTFKVRGALNAVHALSPEQRNRGVIAVSGGNHAQGVAFAAKQLGLHAVLCMPKRTPSNYVEACRELGALVMLVGDSLEEAEVFARQVAVSESLEYVHPFDDLNVVAGQGTVGLGLLEDLPQVKHIVLSIGGGGLCSGVATAVKALKPDVCIWGIETKGADSMSQSLRSGRVIDLPKANSKAVTLNVRKVSQRNFLVAAKYLETNGNGEQVTVVTDEEAGHAQAEVYAHEKFFVELAASCTWEGSKKLKEHFKADEPVALVFCGGNVPVEERSRLQSK